MAGERAKWQATAERMFAAAGDVVFDATIRRGPEGTYVPGTGKTPGETTTPCKILFDTAKQWASRMLTDMVVNPKQKVMLIQGPEWAPAQGDIIEVTGMDEMTVEFVDDIGQLGAVYVVLGS